METPMIQRLRAHLLSITSEQFNQEIAEIESQGFVGITMEEFMINLMVSPTISMLNPSNNIFSSNLKEGYSVETSPNTTFAFAA
jgi:hypothetical protein